MKIVGGKWSNWSGGVVCKPRQIVAPKDEVELAAAVRNAEGTVRVPGTGHSFTPLCATDGTLVDLAAFTGLKGVDPDSTDRDTGRGDAALGRRAGAPRQGFALNNMGDIDRQTLGGVVGTGTHGTGRTLGSLSAEVAGFRLMLASGDVLDCSATENRRSSPPAAVHGHAGRDDRNLDAVRPAYKLVEKNFLLPIAELFEKLDTLVAGNRHFEFFWFPYAERPCARRSISARPRRRSRGGRGDARARRSGAATRCASLPRSTKCCPMRRSCCARRTGCSRG